MIDYSLLFVDSDHQLLPVDLQSELALFSMNGYATSHFAKQSSGIFFRKEMQIKEVMRWQKVHSLELRKKPLGFFYCRLIHF